MANDTDTEDVESPDTSADMDVEGPPEAGFSTGNGSGMGMAQPAQPAQPTVGPMAQQSTAGGGGGLAGNIQGLLQGGLAGGPNVGPMVQQRHGGLLTGLAGVLLDGLASGMAPDAETAAKMPMIRQQQAMQQQQMQMQQQKMQEEMKLAPVREKLLLADTQMKLMQLDHAMQEMSDENQLGISDFQKKWVEKALTENRAEEVMEGTTEDVNKWMQDNVHNPDILKMIPYPKQRGADGKLSRVALVKINPEAMSDPIDRKLDLVGADGKPMTIPVKVGAGPTSWQNAAAMDIVHGAIATQQLQAKAPTEAELEQRGYDEQVKADTAAGKAPPTREQFHRDWTQKAAGGFDEATYQEQKAIKGPGYTRMQYLKDKPTTQIAFAGLGIRQAGEARQEAASEYQATDRTGRRVAGSMAELQAAGFPISRITKQTAVQQQQTDAARDLISPDGLFAIARRQMTDLEAKGKLGPIASRWNNFWAKRGLDGDQQAFRNTLDLLGSRLMAAHLQRTNVSALEHFGKMIPEDSTPAALKTELNEEYKYVLGQGKILGGPAAQ